MDFYLELLSSETDIKSPHTHTMYIVGAHTFLALTRLAERESSERYIYYMGLYFLPLSDVLSLHLKTKIYHLIELHRCGKTIVRLP